MFLPGVACEWDDLLMNGDDPEQRIADLERRLAERKPTADLPPVGTLDAATSRGFVAVAAPPTTKQMMKYTQAAITVAIASLGAAYMPYFSSVPSWGRQPSCRSVAPSCSSRSFYLRC